MPNHINYYIFKIHNLNLIYIWFLRIFNIQIVYHKCILNSKHVIPKNCRQVDDYHDSDQWIECLETSYFDVSIFFENNKIDSVLLPRSTAEMLSKKYEELMCFHIAVYLGGIAVLLFLLGLSHNLIKLF